MNPYRTQVWNLPDIQLVAALAKFALAHPELRDMLLRTTREKEFAEDLEEGFTGDITWKQRRWARRLVERGYATLAARAELEQWIRS